MTNEPDLSGKILATSLDEAAWPGAGPDIPPASPPAKRIDIDPKSVERGLVRLVLSIVELIRQLLERQAIRRVESGRLEEREIEELGQALMSLAQRMQEIKSAFGLTDADLQLDLGTLDDIGESERPR